MIASVWTWIAIVVLIVVWLPLLAVIRLFDRDAAHYRTGRWFRRVGYAMTLVNPRWHVHVDGYRVTDPRHPYVVVSNHQSNADIPVLCYLPWEMKWVAKAELFRIPVVGWLMRMAGDIEVDRRNKLSRARTLVIAADYLRKRCSVMFFPEGTRSKDGRMLNFAEGPFRLAIKTGTPVLPVVVEGTQNALPKHSWKFGQARDIRLRVLVPIPTTGMTEADAPALRDRVRAAIASELAAFRGVEATDVVMGG